MYQIERMTRHWIDEVVVLERQIFEKDAWNREMIQEELVDAPHKHPLVLISEEKLAGYAMLWTIDGEVHLYNFAIHPDFRRRGLGHWFLNAIFDRFREARVMFLEVRATNDAARSLYEKNGFEVFASRRGYYSDGEDALIMKKNLTEAE